MVVFSVVAIICAAGWLCNRMGCMALIMYIQGKDYTLPTDEELKACMTEVVRRMFRVRH